MSFWPRLQTTGAKAPARAGRALVGALILALAAACAAPSTPVTASASAQAADPASDPATSTVSVSPSTATVPVGGVSVPFTATVNDPTNASVTWEVNGIVGGNETVGTISPAGLYLSPAALPLPGTTITVSAVSAADPTQSGSATLTLTATTDPVIVSVTPAVAAVQAGGASVPFTATVSNAANTAVSWQVNGVVGGNSTVGTIGSTGVYTSPAAPPAQPTVTVTAVSVADPTKSGSASVTVSVTPPAPPTISGTPAGTVAAVQAYSFTPVASSPRGAALTFSIANKPSWTSFSATSGQLSGTPATTDVGTFANITISVSDGTATASLAPFTILVTPAAPPTIGGTPGASATVGQVYSFTPVASSPRGAVLTFSIASKPAWASFSPTTGQLSGTPTASSVGTFSGITISVNDGTATASLAPFAITVTAISPPTISGTPATSVAAGQAYSFTPVASSPRGAALIFSIANMPSWASFNTATGQLSGTPTASNVGTYPSIAISVSDGTASASLAPFTITVTATASPTITGTPTTTVKAGNAYSFTPTASSPGGGTLTFSITNMPSWASFSTMTGQLSGTPTAANVGSFANITISVSNGTASASLPSFTITVQAGTTGSATLSWTPPTTRTDGTPLTNLAGYNIYFGTSSGSYTTTIPVTNPGLTTYVVTDLPGGATYYFVMTAVDATGVQSAYTNVASKAIP